MVKIKILGKFNDIMKRKWKTRDPLQQGVRNSADN